MDNPASADIPATAALAAAPAKRPPKGWGKLWASFGLGVAAYLMLVGVEVAGSLLGQVTPIDENALMAASELTAGAAALLFVVALGGKAIARPSLKGMGEAWLAAAWLFAADGLFVVAEVAEFALGIEPFELAADWPVRVGVVALLCLGVGLLEESTMRGLCLNGLLARMGRTRAGVYGAVVLSSLFFGLLHFDFLLDFGDPLQVAQGCMKVLQAGMCGFLLAAILVKTRNLWAVICIHAANDFMLLVVSNGLMDVEVTTEYVQTGSEGVVLLVLYCVLCTLYLPFLFIGKRLIDGASPWRGDFYHHREVPPIAVSAPTSVSQAFAAQALAAQPIPVAARVEPAAPDALHKAYRGRHARVPDPPDLHDHDQGESHDQAIHPR